MINSKQLRSLIVDPTLKACNHYAPNYSDLVMGTMAKESQLGYYLHQIKGPARGIAQCEPYTGNQIVKWVNKTRSEVEIILFYELCSMPLNSTFEDNQKFIDKLTYDLRVQTLFCRYLYLSIKVKVPHPASYTSRNDYLYALGEYWDKYYNRNPRVGTAHEFVKCYHMYVET